MNRVGISMIRNIRIENYSNENIFKQDDYKMKYTLAFSDTDEQNCKKSIFMRHINIIKLMIIFSFWHHVYLLPCWYEHLGLFLTSLTFPVLVILSFGWLMLMNIDRFISFLSFIRLCVEIDNISNIIINCLINTEGEVSSFAFIFIQFSVGMLYNFSFALTLKESTLYYIIEAISVLAFSKYQDKHCLIRLWKNFFSYELAYITVIITIVLSFQYGYSRVLRQFWALYDSFKKSYFTIKCIYDDFPNPILVIKKKDMSLLYKNFAAESLFKKYKNTIKESEEKVQSSKMKTKYDFDYQLKDIVNIQLFEKEISKCWSKGIMCFDFPLSLAAKAFETKENSTFPTWYEGNTNNADWVKVYVFSCEWKQIESVMIQIMDSSNVHRNNWYELEWFENINKQMQTLSRNLNIICKNAPKPESTGSCNTKNKDSNNNVISSNSPWHSGPNIGKSPYVMKHKYNNSNIINNNDFSYLDKVCGKLKKAEVQQKMQNNVNIKESSNYNLNSMLIDKNKNAPANPNYLLNLTNCKWSPLTFKATQEELAKSVIFDTPFDYSLLYLFHINMNYLYDMYLTLEVFNSLKNGKFINHLVKLNLQDFFIYFINYIKPLAKSKGFTIELNYPNLFEDEVEINYIYFRVWLCNILMFIIENVGDVEEKKKIEIRIEHSRFGENDTSSYFLMIFTFNEIKSNINYDKINQLIDCWKNYDIKDWDISKYKTLNLGWLVSYYICNNVFNEQATKNNFTMMQSNKTKQITSSFFIPQKGDKNVKEKKFQNFDCKFAKKAYEKILTKIYCQNTVQIVPKNKKISLYDLGEDDIYLSDEEKYISINNDTIVSQEVAVLLKPWVQAEKIIKNAVVVGKRSDYSAWTKIQFIMKDKENNFGTIYPNTSVWLEKTVINTVFFQTPRFLIVEDNTSLRQGVIDVLNKTQIKYVVDTAQDGEEAREKFKLLLNRGYLFDYIFIDTNLFGMSGVETVRTIREIEKEYNIHTRIAGFIMDENGNDYDKDVFDDNFCKTSLSDDTIYDMIMSYYDQYRPDAKIIINDDF